MFHVKHFDVLVIGGGHAGVEAAAAAARMGAQTALITLRADAIGVMSCNPAIGGLGKGHLVREIDALDGIMGRAADKAGIQFRLLNRRKGPAVQGPRAQADRKLYRTAVQSLISDQAGVEVIEGEVVAFRLEAGTVTGVELADDTRIGARAVVLTAGTFLNGIIHIGDVRRPGGRIGDTPSVRLAAQLAEISNVAGRLKTGTPPRLDGTTIDWAKLEMQPGDEDPVLFSFLHRQPFARQISCGITHTNERTHEIVRQNLHRSAMYGGHIEGVGPRYCPSIEDKVVRFAEKLSHQVFLEPEGLDDPTIYPNGISSSLPVEVQEAYVRSIEGLENVRITQPAYAIEYDYFDPTRLDRTLMSREIAGLYLAGQINGTTGYEEAGAQGLVAGLNAAARALGRDTVTFSRADSYIGVMIDDLLTLGVTEPYRMFTSRAEYRLSLRADNADQRLTPLGIRIGCVSSDRAKTFERKRDGLEKAKQDLESIMVSPKTLVANGVSVSADGAKRNAFQLLAFPYITPEQMNMIVPAMAELDSEIRSQIEKDALYHQYLVRQADDIAALKREEAAAIPDDLVYTDLPGLSGELAAKLERRKPETLAQASRIEGMTPAGLTLILAHIKKARRGAAR